MSSLTLLETAYNRASRSPRASAALRAEISVTIARAPITRPASSSAGLAETMAQKNEPSRRRMRRSYCSLTPCMRRANCERASSTASSSSIS